LVRNKADVSDIHLISNFVNCVNITESKVDSFLTYNSVFREKAISKGLPIAPGIFIGTYTDFNEDDEVLPYKEDIEWHFLNNQVGIYGQKAVGNIKKNKINIDKIALRPYQQEDKDKIVAKYALGCLLLIAAVMGYGKTFLMAGTNLLSSISIF